MLRRSFLAGGAGIVAGATVGGPSWGAATPGVTATTLKIGNTMPYSGPASSYGNIGRGDAAFFKMVNEQGGVGGRKIDFISLDDSYSPPRTVEQVRKLVEEDEVAFLFNTLGTPPNTAIERYLNAKKIPQLFVATGADKWGNYKKYPWTMGFQPSYRAEAEIYAKYILAEKPDAKIAILYQDDDFGKDYVTGVRDGLGDKFGKMVVKQASYEVSDPTVNSQIVELQSSGANTLIVAAVPKFAAQAIRQVFDIGWKPLFFMTNVSISTAQVLKPAGEQKAVGMITATYLKDPTDPMWKDDPGIKEWRAFMAKYLPNADISDGNYTYSYAVAQTMVQVLKQCNGDFSRANVMKQAANIHDFVPATLVPGVKVSTSPTNYHPIRGMRLARWDGKMFKPFGKVIESTAS